MSSDGAGRLTGTAEVTSSGKLFQTLAPAIGKARVSRARFRTKVRFRVRVSGPSE